MSLFFQKPKIIHDIPIFYIYIYTHAHTYIYITLYIYIHIPHDLGLINHLSWLNPRFRPHPGRCAHGDGAGSAVGSGRQGATPWFFGA